MDRAVIQALNGLVPSLSGPLPPELIELATSLLAQSRNKASSLKADEEIARTYACANIACERLKQNLVLPKIQPRPPCPPKVYQKLYKYLDGALPAGIRKSGRASRLNDPASTPASSPAKPRTPAHVRPDIPRRKTPQRKALSTPEVPQWVMPAIRQLCKQMSTPAAPHHIFAGVSSILSSLDTVDASELNIPALIVALFSLVATRLEGVRKQPKEYSERIARAVNALNNSVGDAVKHKNIEEADVDNCMKEIRDHEWTKMDSFRNIPVGEGLGGDEAETADSDSDEDDMDDIQLLPAKRRKLDTTQPANENYLQAGLGTMMQDRVDYLSDERRHDYQIWKKAFMIRIDELEKAEEMNPTAG